MASSAIVHDSLRVVDATNFVDKYDSTPSISDYLYLGISGTTAWTDEINPPAPTTKLDEKTSFWTELIGLHRIQITDIAPAIPRINWTSGTEYFVLDTSLDNPWVQETYVLASNNYVYRCASKPAPGATVTTEPNGTGQGVDYGDGYTWDFMYDLSSYDQTNLLTSSWLPVNWQEKQSTLQASNGDVDAVNSLNAKYVVVRAKILDTDLPTGVTYRKLALIENPLDNLGGACTNNNYLPAELTSNSGNLVYMEHRPPITRNSGQFEEIKIIIEF